MGGVTELTLINGCGLPYSLFYDIDIEGIDTNNSMQ